MSRLGIMFLAKKKKRKPPIRLIFAPVVITLCDTTVDAVTLGLLSYL